MLKFSTALPIFDSERSKFMRFEESQLTTFSRGINGKNTANGALRSAEWTGFKRSRSWDSELAATPDVRKDTVARGKALIADPNYPSKTQLESIAHLLVDRLSPVKARRP